MFSKDDYDITPTVYSPDGRIFQVEYAREAIKRGALGIGVRSPEWVVLASLRPEEGRLIEKEYVKKQYFITRRIVAITSGLIADGRILVDILRERAQEEWLTYGEEATISSLVKWLCRICELYTRFEGIRPFGAALLIGGFDATGPRLYDVDPSGVGREVKAWAIGRGSEEVLPELEKIDMQKLREDIRRVFKMVYEKGVVDVIVLSKEGVISQEEIRFSGGRKEG
ncbi:MAG: proteasome subunit alpha [Thermoplasmata archaeon]|nr:proteasome subunit alpha [Thermoplasmata archaeon]